MDSNIRKELRSKPFLLLDIGPIGAGKSSAMMQVLKGVEGKFDRCIVFSGNSLDPLLDKLSSGCEILNDDPEELERVTAEIMSTQKNRKAEGKKLEKYLMVLDDVAANPMFFRQGRSDFNKFIMSLRHLNTSMIITSQQYHLLPRVIRLNATGMLLFRLNDTDWKDVLSELPFPKRQLNLGYQVATQRPHSFLYADIKNRQLYKGLDEKISA